MKMIIWLVEQVQILCGKLLTSHVPSWANLCSPTFDCTTNYNLQLLGTNIISPELHSAAEECVLILTIQHFADFQKKSKLLEGTFFRF